MKSTEWIYNNYKIKFRICNKRTNTAKRKIRRETTIRSVIGKKMLDTRLNTVKNYHTAEYREELKTVAPAK